MIEPLYFIVVEGDQKGKDKVKKSSKDDADIDKIKRAKVDFANPRSDFLSPRLSTTGNMLFSMRGTDREGKAAAKAFKDAGFKVLFDGDKAKTKAYLYHQSRIDEWDPLCPAQTREPPSRLVRVAGHIKRNKIAYTVGATIATATAATYYFFGG